LNYLTSLYNPRFSLSSRVYLHFQIPPALCLFLFSQDDLRVCMDFNIIQKDSTPVCPVDASGCFTEVTHVGQYVKVRHSLIYKSVPSWFERVEHMVDQLLKNNDLCYWSSSLCDPVSPASWS
ncbi:Isoleucine--tRNA ligase, cytoplasmic, partial [Lemmus lemmus]